MLVKKGQLLEVIHNRKGKFIAVAQEDFNSSEVDFFPLALAVNQEVVGRDTIWGVGDRIPCRKTICSIKFYNKSVEVRE